VSYLNIAEQNPSLAGFACGPSCRCSACRSPRGGLGERYIQGLGEEEEPPPSAPTVAAHRQSTFRYGYAALGLSGAGHLGQPTHTPAPPTGVVIPPPAAAPAPAPAQGAQPLSLPPARLTRVADTRLAPFASICRIVARTAGGGESFGTGILIGPYHVLTCAHVIFPPQNPLTKEIVVFPGQNGPDSHCRVKSDGWAVSPAYHANNCNTAGEDYGIIRLSCPMNPGFMLLRAFDPTTLRGATVSLAGYPWGRSEKARHMYFSRGTIRSGITITSCTGTLAKGNATLLNVPITPTTSLITHDLETAPTQSGSPMWIVQAGGRFLIALHAGRVAANARGKAVLLNEAVRRRVAEWMTRTLPPLPLPM
jgi:V8-like Glu-specific endopeptidase